MYVKYIIKIFIESENKNRFFWCYPLPLFLNKFIRNSYKNYEPRVPIDLESQNFF